MKTTQNKLISELRVTRGKLTRTIDFFTAARDVCDFALAEAKKKSVVKPKKKAAR